jgi:hypothetical protein
VHCNPPNNHPLKVFLYIVDVKNGKCPPFMCIQSHFKIKTSSHAMINIKLSINGLGVTIMHYRSRCVSHPAPHPQIFQLMHLCVIIPFLLVHCNPPNNHPLKVFLYIVDVKNGKCPSNNKYLKNLKIN